MQNFEVAVIEVANGWGIEGVRLAEARKHPSVQSFLASTQLGQGARCRSADHCFTKISKTRSAMHYCCNSSNLGYKQEWSSICLECILGAAEFHSCSFSDPDHL
jgi:hypothetical protein